jgi:hypothetical protein
MTRISSAGTGWRNAKNAKDELQRRDPMCPACIASSAVMVAGATSTGGMLAVCIGKIRKFFRPSGWSLTQKTKEK